MPINKKISKLASSNKGVKEINDQGQNPRSKSSLFRRYGLLFSVFSSGFIASLGIFFTPLLDGLYHKIYKENIEIKHIVDNKRIYEGEDLAYQILVIPNSSADISRGVMTLIYNDSVFAMREGQLVYDIPSSKNPMLIPSESKIRLKPKREGRHLVKTIIETQYGIYKDSVKIEVLPSANMIRPTQHNFSGMWDFKMGYEDGKMELLDRNGKISGSYTMNNGDIGSISGVRDGNVFMADFIRKGELKKWHIDANWKMDKDFIEIKGSTRLLKIGNNIWLEADKDPKVFYSNVYLF